MKTTAILAMVPQIEGYGGTNAAKKGENSVNGKTETGARVLGCDPGNNFGWALSKAVNGVWQIKEKDDVHPGRRLERLRRLLFRLKREQGFDAIATEDASFGSINPNGAARHNELKGVLMLCAAEWEIPFFAFTPTSIKKWLTGHGRATKECMIYHVKDRFGVSTDDDNLADAVAVHFMAKEKWSENHDSD